MNPYSNYKIEWILFTKLVYFLFVHWNTFQERIKSMKYQALQTEQLKEKLKN